MNKTTLLMLSALAFFSTSCFGQTILKGDSDSSKLHSLSLKTFPHFVKQGVNFQGSSRFGSASSSTFQGDWIAHVACTSPTPDYSSVSVKISVGRLIYDASEKTCNSSGLTYDLTGEVAGLQSNFWEASKQTSLFSPNLNLKDIVIRLNKPSPNSSIMWTPRFDARTTTNTSTPLKVLVKIPDGYHIVGSTPASVIVLYSTWNQYSMTPTNPNMNMSGATGFSSPPVYAPLSGDTLNPTMLTVTLPEIMTNMTNMVITNQVHIFVFTMEKNSVVQPLLQKTVPNRKEMNSPPAPPYVPDSSSPPGMNPYSLTPEQITYFNRR